LYWPSLWLILLFLDSIFDVSCNCFCAYYLALCLQYVQFNFVGRILGPRGMTAKQLEVDTGCKIMVRGKGSMRDKIKVPPLISVVVASL